MNNLYDRIVEQTKQLNMTGKELGEAIGLKKSPLTDWKNKKSKPTIEQIIKMCEIFAIPTDYLLLGKNTKETLTENEKELLAQFRKLPEREQIKFIGRAEEAASKFTTENNIQDKVI